MGNWDWPGSDCPYCRILAVVAVVVDATVEDGMASEVGRGIRPAVVAGNPQVVADY